MPTRHILYVAAITLFVVAFSPVAAHGDLITNPGDFAILGHGSVSIADGLTATGNVGGGTYLSMGSGINLTGNAYSGGTMDIGASSTIVGNLIGAGNVWLDRDSTAGSIDSGGSASFGAGVRVADVVSAGGVYLPGNAVVDGNLTSGGYFSMASSAVITGNLTYGSSYWTPSSARIDGAVSQGVASPQAWSTSWLSSYSDPGLAAGVGRGGSDDALSPGAYGRLEAPSTTTVQLVAGDYSFDSVWFGQGSQLLVDTSDGDVTINVAGGFSANSNVSIVNTGSGRISLLTGGDVSFGADADIDASIFSLAGGISIDRNADISGTLYSGGDLWLGSNVTIAPMQEVPEPAFGALVLAVGVLATRRRRTTCL